MINELIFVSHEQVEFGPVDESGDLARLVHAVSGTHGDSWGNAMRYNNYGRIGGPLVSVPGHKRVDRHRTQGCPPGRKIVQSTSHDLP